MKMEIKKAMDYAIKCHSETNHLYDGKPYETHLKIVFNYAFKYSHLLSIDKRNIALCSAWTHDVIEDCRQTYNDVKNELGIEVAEITYLLTNEKGKTRKERANNEYYEGILSDEVALFVKVCDRLANVKYSKETKSLMFDKYKKENTFFTEKLYVSQFKEMFSELVYLLNHSPSI